MDIILLFLAKPLDKHGTTLAHITYPPLGYIFTVLFSTVLQLYDGSLWCATCYISKNAKHYQEKELLRL